MIHIDASQLDHRRLNEQIRHSPGTLRITGCLGQRFIGAGAERGRLEITGTPGNALGAYLDGACIEVRGNAQDAVGDTMNGGRSTAASATPPDTPCGAARSTCRGMPATARAST